MGFRLIHVAQYLNLKEKSLRKVMILAGIDVRFSGLRRRVGQPIYLPLADYPELSRCEAKALIRAARLRTGRIQTKILSLVDPETDPHSDSDRPEEQSPRLESG
jgi:hypothetical protein